MIRTVSFMRKRIFTQIIAFVAVLLLAQAAPAAELFPTIEVETLLGKKLTLPDAMKGHASVLIIGFTHASQSEIKAWGERLEADLHPYSMAVLQDVPRLVRGMATGGIKGSVPDSRKDRFLLTFRGEKELKDAVTFKTPNDAYIVLVDSNGAIQWQSHGAVSDATVGELEMHLHALNSGQ